MGFLDGALRGKFEDKKPDSLKADIRMISGCEDAQTSADVYNVASFSLPDPAGRAGGACTSALLNVLYKDHKTPEDTYSFTQVLELMRGQLEDKGYTQIPQLSSAKPIDLTTPFDLVPETATGTRRGVLIGINYIGHEQGVLSGCHNDVGNMIDYMKDIHGFQDENITVLMDDGEHDPPTRENILNAYRTLVEQSEPGDAIFCHYSGHGTKIRDDDYGEEDDGYDEALVPVDYQEAGLIRDDILYDILVKPLKEGIHLVCLMDCCHSGTILDLPYIFKSNGEFEAMEIDEKFNFGKLFGRLGGAIGGLFD